MCIEESFDTIFNMGYGGGVHGTSPMDERAHLTYCTLDVKIYIQGDKNP